MRAAASTPTVPPRRSRRRRSGRSARPRARACARTLTIATGTKKRADEDHGRHEDRVLRDRRHDRPPAATRRARGRARAARAAARHSGRCAGSGGRAPRSAEPTRGALLLSLPWPDRAGSVRWPAPAPWAPVPPVPLPEGRIVLVPDRGEMLVRDSGGSGRRCFLLHGWTVAADLTGPRCTGRSPRPASASSATDHRGHGRGPRPDAPFRLQDCADDAAELVRTLGVGPRHRRRLLDGRTDRAAHGARPPATSSAALVPCATAAAGTSSA
jgi:hypothetical protein